MSDWVTVKQAADILGISEDAVRKRMKRGLLQKTRLDNVWHVLLEQDKTPQDIPPKTAPAAGGELEDALRAQIEQLTQQNAQLWEQFSRVNATLDRQSQTLDRILALPAMTATRQDEDAEADALRQQMAAQAEQLTKLNEALEAQREQAATAEPKRQASWWQRTFGRRE